MVRSKERCLVPNSYKPSIVTFHLSLHVSEILPFLCCSMPLFPTPPLYYSPTFPQVPLGVGGWATKSEDVGLIVRAINFQDFQVM